MPAIQFDSTDGAPATFDRCILRSLSVEPSYFSPTCILTLDATFFDVEIFLDLPVTEARGYEHSKLYYSVGPNFEFSEDRVITFRVDVLRLPRRIRVLIPHAIKTEGPIRIRIDPAPMAEAGEYALTAIWILPDDTSETSRHARIEAHKEWVRRRVEATEAIAQPMLDHYPSSLSIELTPRCNLTCGHCSSHGQPDLHQMHNRMPEMSPDVLKRLADEVFPSLTSICIVGRGEPTMTSHELWGTLTKSVIKHRVLLSIVTNGHFIKRRITPELLPFIDSVMFSIDGTESKTFAANRGGADFDQVWDAVEWFHNLRKSSNLARRPRLNFSWTLKRNNIAQFPEFVRRIAAVEADLLYARHLLVFFEKDREQSVMDESVLANPYLLEAYNLLERYNIRSDCVPLIATAPHDQNSKGVERTIIQMQQATPAKRDGCMFIHRTGVILADGEVPTCTAPFVKVAGYVGREPTFMNIWNGPVMKGVRASLNTSAEWKQCQDCWYREGTYKRQRTAITELRRHDITQASSFTEKSWDFRAQDKTPRLS
jgi:MoaA/NifB/PqqE/SkfB family radical SAM enzyme